MPLGEQQTACSLGTQDFSLGHVTRALPTLEGSKARDTSKVGINMPISVSETFPSFGQVAVKSRIDEGTPILVTYQY